MEVVRSYTPVLNSLEPMIIDDGTLNLLIKTYNDGALTPVIKNTEIGNKHSKKWKNTLLNFFKFSGSTLSISDHTGSFDSANILPNLCQLHLLAAGTGFTPMAKLIQSCLVMPSPPQITLIFFNKTQSDIMWRDQLDRLQGQFQALAVHHVLSQEQGAWEGPTGRISMALLKSLLPMKKVEEGKKVLAAVCGPNPFTDATKK